MMLIRALALKVIVNLRSRLKLCFVPVILRGKVFFWTDNYTFGISILDFHCDVSKLKTRFVTIPLTI